MNRETRTLFFCFHDLIIHKMLPGSENYVAHKAIKCQNSIIHVPKQDFSLHVSLYSMLPINHCMDLYYPYCDYNIRSYKVLSYDIRWMYFPRCYDFYARKIRAINLMRGFKTERLDGRF